MSQRIGILLVDDSPTQRLSLAGLLEDAGYDDLHGVDSAQQAFALLRDLTAHDIGLILMDLNMPGIDGVEACRRIKALSEWSDTPVIMVTSSEERDDLRRAFAAGALDYITKPPDEVQLLARVQSALRLRSETEQRKAREQALSKSEERLSNVLGSAMDAILTIGSNQRITLFNRAAEQIFRCDPSDAIGQPIERYFAPRSRTVLAACLRARDPRERSQLWAPEGLYGIRAGGEEFPIEVTVSPLTIDGSQHHTLILRDINERDRACDALRRLQAEHRNLQEVVQREHQIDGFIGDAPVMQPVLQSIRQVAPGDTTVLITGETGTGKELVARAIHYASPRNTRPLVPVNCAALPGELIESELFGHERGAFTGATGQRKGRFELAHGGTIFLDEVGELTAKAQAKLLRVLQEQQFERVGGSHTLKVDVRVIAATNRDLLEMVGKGAFRADLYYRLNVFPIHVPPLRERVVDIRAIAEHFLLSCSRKLGKEYSGFLPLSLERLRRYTWPGNVRELQNVVERAAILGRPPLLEVLASQLPVTAPPDVGGANAASATAGDVLRSHILRVLEDRRWLIEGKQGAAAVLGMKPSTLRYRMKQLGIRKDKPQALLG
jgi:formate hydrogenlyase transcriptional activator